MPDFNNDVPNIDNLRALFVQTDKLLIKNYKELCNILEIEYQTAGNSKKMQLRNLQRYFSYYQEGQSFVIDDIYDIPLPFNLFSQPIDLLCEYFICKLASESKNSTITCSMNELALRIGFINENFNNFKSHKNQLAKAYIHNNNLPLSDLETSLQACRNVYDIIPHRYKYRIKKALKSLSQKALIAYSEIYLGLKVDITPNSDFSNIIKEAQTDEWGDIFTSYKVSPDISFVPLSDEQIKKFLEIEKSLLNDYSCESISDLYTWDKSTNSLLLTSFLPEFNKKLKKELGFDFIFPCFKITTNKEYIAEEQDKIFSQINSFQLFSDSFYNSLSDNTENKYQRKIENIYALLDKRKISSQQAKKDVSYYQKLAEIEKKLLFFFNPLSNYDSSNRNSIKLNQKTEIKTKEDIINSLIQIPDSELDFNFDD